MVGPVNRNGYFWAATFLLLGACGSGATLTGEGADAGAASDGASTDAARPDAGTDADSDAGPNMPPAISAIDDQSTQFPAIGPIAFDISDAETAPADLVVTATSSDQAVVPDANITLAGTAGQRTIALTPTASGTATITIAVNDGTTNSFGSFLLSVTNQAPTASADSYSAVGNSAIDVAVDSGVLANDTDDDGDTVTAIADSIVSSMGGSVTLASDGSFNYLPPVGLKDSVDSFEYQSTDGFVRSTGVASVSVNNLVWYVDSAAPAVGDGRSTLPFQTLSEAETASGEADILFVNGGSYDTGISLKNDQILLGAPAGLTVDATELIAPAAGARPIMTNATGVGVQLAARGEIRGIAIENTSSDGINGDAVTSVVIGNILVTNAGGQSIDLGNPNPSGPVDIEIRDATLVGRSDFATTPIGIDIQVAGNGGGRAQVAIRDSQIRQVPIGVFIAVAGSTGNGADGPNSIAFSGNTVSDYSVDGVQIEPDDTATTAVTIENNTIDGSDTLAAVTRETGFDFRVRTTTGGSTDLTMQDNTIRDNGTLACANLVSSGSNNGGDFRLLVQNNVFSNCGQSGLLIAPDDAVQLFATVDGNTMIGNGAPSTFEFITGTAHRMDLNLLNNEDDSGFQLERSTVGTFNLAGQLGTGASFDDDNGNIANNGNTTAGGAPFITIVNEASPLQINIVDAATIPTP